MSRNNELIEALIASCEEFAQDIEAVSVEGDELNLSELQGVIKKQKTRIGELKKKFRL